MDPRPLGHRDLRGQVRRGPEAVDAQPAARRQRTAAQRPVADDARAQQRRQLGRVLPVGERIGVVRRDEGRRGEAAVGVPAGVPGGRAEVLAAGAAVPAPAAGAPQPGPAGPVADPEPGDRVAGGGHPADDLVPRYGLRAPRRQVPLGQVQIRTADPARLDVEQQLPRAGFRQRAPYRRQRTGGDRAGPVDGPAGHRVPAGDRRRDVSRAASHVPRMAPSHEADKRGTATRTAGGRPGIRRGAEPTDVGRPDATSGCLRICPVGGR